MLLEDPLQKDRAIALLAQRYRRFRAALAESDALDHVFEEPIAGLDRELLSELRGRPKPDPFVLGTRRWLEFLLIEQDSIAELRAVAGALFRERHPVEDPGRGSFTLKEIGMRALRETERADRWLGELAARGQRLSARRFALWERRQQLRGELGLEPKPDREFTESLGLEALRLLGETDDAFSELGAKSWKEYLTTALGADLTGEWPTRISLRSMVELVREEDWFRGLSLEPFEKGAPLGASSVMRGLAALGRRLHDAAASGLPFVLGHDPEARRAEMAGALFALLLVNPSFVTRRLGVGGARSSAFLRRLHEVLLIAVRQSALCVLLFDRGGSTSAFQERFEESVSRSLGFPIPGTLAGVLYARERSTSKFAGLLWAGLRNHELIERHDDDWYRNPRAIQELRAEYETPPWLASPKGVLESGARRWVSLLSSGR